MCVCVYVYVCVFVCMYVCVCVCVYMYVRLCVCLFVCSCVFVGMCVSVCMCICVLGHQGRQWICSWSKGGELVGNLNILHFAKNVAAQDSYLNTQSHRHRAEMTENGEINHLQDISITGAMYVCMHRCNIWSLMFP